jgi:hypothetical protein
VSTPNIVLYPRQVFRTTRSVSILALGMFVIVLALILLRGTRSGQSVLTMMSLSTCSLFPVLATNRIVKVLHRLERERAEAGAGPGVDDAMATLFDMALLMPPLINAPILIAVRLL